MRDVDDDLLSAAYIASPYATYDLLREEAPVYFSAKWAAWLVTRYDDVFAVLRDSAHFSNRGRYTQYLGQRSDAERGQLAGLIEHYEHGGLVQSDPPDSHALTPPREPRLHARVRWRRCRLQR